MKFYLNYKSHVGLFFLLFLLCATSFAQNTNTVVRGKVVDGLDKSFLPGVSVSVAGTTKGVLTNVNGDFEITLATPNASLIFSFIGYQSQTIPVNGKTTVNVELVTTSTQLNQVVVVGYGTQKKANLTGSVASVNMDDIQGVPIANVATALQGRLPGVTISAFNSQPGKNDPQIRIRGIGTLGNNSPLVVIDGVPTGVGDLGDLSADDIESISVLKDAASASIYGVRAANGVILVTTRRGQTGKAKIQFRETQTIQKALLKPDYMDALTWAKTYNNFLVETGSIELFTPDNLQKISDQSDPDHFANTDWFNEVYKPALLQSHYISASGGSDASKYLISAEYQKQDGLMINTGSDRLQLRANIDNKISEKVSFGLNLRGYKQKISEPIAAADGNDSGDNGINRIISGFTRPITPAYYSFGQLGTTDGSGLATIKNPLRLLTQQQFDTDDYQLDGKLFGEVKIIKDLSFVSSLAFNFSNTNVVRFSPSYPQYGPDNTITGVAPLNNLFNQNLTGRGFTNENLLRYNKKIDKHDLKFLLGHTIQHQEGYNINGRVVNLPSNNIRVLSGSTELATNGGTASAYSLQSFLGRVNYIYDNKYLFEANARIDGSSRLPESQQYPIFPSVSAGWILSEESFLKNNKYISLLKIRGSYGVLGNQEIGNYSFTQNYGLGQNYVFNNAVVQGVAITGLANADIKWETTKLADIGLDMEFFGGKLGFVADYFDKNTSDILYTIPIPATLGGLNPPVQNVAKVNNKGFELSITHNNSVGKFNYNLALNGSVIKNKIVDLAGRLDVITGNFLLTPGQPINSFYGYISDGIIRTQEELNAAPTGLGSVALRLGDKRYRDLDGDGKITTADRKIIGNAFPKLDYGFNMAGSYKGFDLSIFLQGIAGIDRYFNDPAQMGIRSQKLNVWNNRYTTSNTEGNLPRFGNPGNNNAFSTFGAAGAVGFLDGSYLRLKNLEFGYSIPTKYLSKVGMSNVRLYFSGVNLYTFTKVKNYDVEKAQDDNGSYSYLNTKNYAFGLSIKL